MENPSTWKPVELIIMDSLDDWEDLANAGVFGISKVHFIAQRLRDKGYINDDDVPAIGWDGIHNHVREPMTHGDDES